MSRWWLVVAALAPVLACSQLRGDVLYRCDDGGSCPDGLRCGATVTTSGTLMNVCLPATGDAGTVDSGTDSGAADASVDAGGADAGADAGTPDASVDAGPPDAGLDAGTSCVSRCPSQLPPGSHCLLFDAGAGCEPVHCGGACPLGGSCAPSGQCDVVPVCVNGWCSDFPLPQGNHLTAAHGEEADDGGEAFFAWGGEQGVLFEWDTVTTRYRPLPGAHGRLLGFLGNVRDGDLRALTSRGQVYLRGDAGAWLLDDSVEALVEECGATNLEPGGTLLLGCTVLDGGSRRATIFEFEVRGARVRRTFTLPSVDGGFTPTEVTALVRARRGPRVLVAGRSATQQRTLLFAAPSDGGAYEPFPTPRVALNDGGTEPLDQLLGAERLNASARARGSVVLVSAGDDYRGTLLFLEDDLPGAWEWYGERTLALNDVQGHDGEPVLAGRGLVFAGPSFGLLPPDAGSVLLVPLPTAALLRNWHAVAAAGETVLAVGSFGATAVFRRGPAMMTSEGPIVPGVLRSSLIAMRPTDLCGQASGGPPVLTVSANDLPRDVPLPPGWAGRRPHDAVLFTEPLDQTTWSGALVRLDAGWVPVPKPATELWSPATDQCSVDDLGQLHLVNPPLLQRRAVDGGWSARALPNLLRDGGYEYVGLFVDGQDDVYASPIEGAVGVVPLDGGTGSLLNRLVVEGGSVFNATDTTAVSRASPSTLAGVSGRLKVRDGGVWAATTSSLNFKAFVEGRARGDGGVALFLARHNVATGIVGLWTYTGQDCGALPLIDCLGGFVRERQLPTEQSPLRAWVDFDERPWLLTVDVGGDVLPLDAQYRVVKVAADGGQTIFDTPPSWFLPHASEVGATLWGTRSTLYLQGPRGVWVRSKP